MITFTIGLVILIVGSALYGKLCEKVFQPDDRKTPAYEKEDGVDYVPMKTWRNSLIHLLNIAGTGPILGPIQGILFGPIAFITIPIGNVIGGAVHDYFCGMIMMREGGIQAPEMLRRYTNKVVHRIFLVFVTVVLILIGAVFIYTPGDIFSTQVLGLDGAATSASTWIIYGAIFAYYLIATCFPIDKIIGRIYPIFGLILLFSAVGVFVGMIATGYMSYLIEIWDVWNVANVAYGDYFQTMHFIPVMFITIACGILSGFHSTQVAIITRTVQSERQGKTVFYRMMSVEGFIAMCWAAGAMCVYNMGLQNADASLATSTVGVICRTLLGPVGGTIAIIGVIILPITSGDTALRSVRMSIAEFLHLDQKPILNRMLIAVPVFAVTGGLLVWAKLGSGGFARLWQYFGWANQTLAVFAFVAIIVWMYENKKQKYVWIAFVPAVFYTFVTASYILNAQIGFRQSWTVSYIGGAIVAAAYLGVMVWYGRKRASRAQLSGQNS